jgi:glycosyltransferase involved in cell wall biosynthesis
MKRGCSLPKVVALMPAWNAESFIVPVLESLAAQTYPNLQVLISDDASTDRTAAICEEFAARHANFRLIRQPRNLGWIGNVNALLSKAEGEYFFFAFHDDLPRPAYVERLVDALESNPRAVLAFSDMIRRGAAVGPVLDDIKVYRDLEGITDRVERGVRVARRQGKRPSYLVTVANRGLFRASAARQVGGLRRHIAGEFGADWPWLLHLSLLGEFVRVPDALIEKRYRRTSLSATWKHSAWQWMGVFFACMREIRRAKLPMAEELIIHRELVGYPLKRQWWGIHARLRRFGSRLWPPAAGD